MPGILELSDSSPLENGESEGRQQQSSSQADLMAKSFSFIFSRWGSLKGWMLQSSLLCHCSEEDGGEKPGLSRAKES